MDNKKPPIDLTFTEKAELKGLIRKHHSDPSRVFTLEKCKDLKESKDRNAFESDKRNIARAIQLHTPEVGVEIASLFFDWYQASKDIEWVEIIQLWKKLLVEISDIQENAPIEALLWHQMGILEHSRGNLDLAREYLEKSLSIKQGKNLAGANHYELGIVYRNSGEYEKAWREFTDSETSANAEGDLKTVIFAKGQQANLLAVQSKIGQAIDLLKETLVIWDTFSDEGDRDLRHTTLHTLGRTYLQNGQYLEAIPLLVESLQLKEKVRERFDSILRTKTMLAEAYINLGEYEQAKQYLLEDDVENAVNTGSYLYAAVAFKTLSQLQFAMGDRQTSDRLARRAVEIAERSGNLLSKFEVLTWLITLRLRSLYIFSIPPLLFDLLRTLISLQLPFSQLFRLAISRVTRMRNFIRGTHENHKR